MTDVPPKTALLQRTDLFRLLDPHALEAVAAKSGTSCVAAGESLLNQGDDPDRLFVVAEGRFKMTTLSPDGTQITLRFMQPGDVIGCAAVFRGFPYPATATAVVDSRVLSWSAGKFDQLIRSHPQLAANALAIVGGRAEDMLQRLREVKTKRADQWLARALQRLVATTASTPEHDATIVRISRQELAELSDTTLFTVSRAISAWARAGIVGSGRGQIVVRDLQRLSRIADTSAE